MFIIIGSSSSSSSSSNICIYDILATISSSIIISITTGYYIHY